MLHTITLHAHIFIDWDHWHCLLIAFIVHGRQKQSTYSSRVCAYESELCIWQLLAVRLPGLDRTLSRVVIRLPTVAVHTHECVVQGY